LDPLTKNEHIRRQKIKGAAISIAQKGDGALIKEVALRILKRAGGSTGRTAGRQSKYWMISQN